MPEKALHETEYKYCIEDNIDKEQRRREMEEFGIYMCSDKECLMYVAIDVYEDCDDEWKR